MNSACRFLVTFLLASLIGSAASARATVLAGWDFNGLTDGGTSPLAAATTDAAVSVSGLTRPNPFTATNSGANTFGSNGLTGQNQAAALSSNSVFNLEITTAVPNVSISNIGAYNIWIYEYNTTGVPNPSILNGIWQYSLDGTNFTDIGSSFSLGTVSEVGAGPGNPGNPMTSVDLTGISSLQSMASGTAVDLRFVVWGGGYGANYAGFNSFQSGDDLVVNGTVPVPEPSMSLLGLAALGVGLAAVRLRRTAT